MFTVSYVTISTIFFSISGIIKMLWTLRYQNSAVAKDISLFCIPIACWDFLLVNYWLFKEYGYEYYSCYLLFFWCHWLSDICTASISFLMSWIYLSIAVVSFSGWGCLWSAGSWNWELQDLFLFQAASSLQFPISLCAVAVHRQITWFRATVMSWPKLDEAMNGHNCKEPVTMI